MNSRNPFKRLIQTIMFDGIESFGRHYSCYRGFVISNIDPKNMDRLFVRVPHISGSKIEGNWAWPKGKPYTQRELPKIGDMVWVEFERGDHRFPVWSFCNQARTLEEQTEQPEVIDPDIRRYGGEKGNSVDINDRNDSVDLKHRSGSTAKINNETIELRHFAGSEVEVYDNRIEIIEQAGSRIILQNGEVIINGGSYGGLIKISDLISKLNQLEQAMMTHIHPTAVGPSSPQTTVVITPTQRVELENPDVKH